MSAKKMKNTIRKIAAGLAMLIGLMSAITGSRALLGLFDPGYQTFPILILYNILMGLVSILAAWLIWKNHKQAFTLSAMITSGHILVLISLITVFRDIIAIQSIHAMIFRSVLWILILLMLIWDRASIRTTK